MINKTLQSRYKFKTFAELALRVATNIGSDRLEISEYHNLINSKRFIPAGNTLLAGINPIRPNCAILPSIAEYNFDELSKRSRKIWKDRIGIGFDLSESKNPVKLLYKLSEINAGINLEHRPQRGNMAVLSSKHSNIVEFIKCKDDSNKLYNFNISVSLEFDDIHNTELMKLCAEQAWSSGDPGIVFLDRIQLDGISGLSELGQIKTLVPCGEQGMFDNEVCTLGSINLNSDEFWNKNNSLNEKLFCESVKLSVRFLDDVIDKMSFNDIELRFQSLNTRRIGLGVMGFADILNRHKIIYGSDQSLQLIDYIGDLFQKNAQIASNKLAIEKGVCPVFQNIDDDIQIKRRNITVTCIAPTGGITLLTDNKGFAIEPLFEEAHSISPENHIKIQSAWQKYVDNCISKTINLPNNTSKEDIVHVWQIANEYKLKSITVYRDGSKQFQPIITDNSKSDSVAEKLRDYGFPDCISGKCHI